jgi:hypothetical protein
MAAGQCPAAMHWQALLPELSLRASLAVQLYGLLVGAPAAHHWQATLERVFPNRADPLRAVKKVLLDQVSYGPVANLTYFRCAVASP